MTAPAISKAAKRRDDSTPFDSPSFEKVEKGLGGPWERAADRAIERRLREADWKAHALGFLRGLISRG